MENIYISVTDNNSIIVKADTKRFGKNAIMYEDTTFMRCCDYIRRMTGKNNFKLNSLYGVPMLTDAEGRTLPRFIEVDISNN